MCPEAARSVRAGAGVRSYLEAPGQELVLDLQEVAAVDLALEGLVEDGVADVVLDVLPARVAVSGAGGVMETTDTHTSGSTHTHAVHILKDSSLDLRRLLRPQMMFLLI